MTDIFDVSDYMGLFLDEVDEKLQELSKELLSLEKNGEDNEAIQKIFRAAHTLKGSSGAMGFSKMQEVTHCMENVLDKIRKNEIYVSTDIITLLFECLDTLRLLKESISDNSKPEPDVSELIGKLSLVGISEKKQEEEPFECREFILDFSEDIKEILKSGIIHGQKALAVYVRIVPECQMKSIRAYLVANNLKELGEIVTSIPDKEQLDNDRFTDSFIYIVLTDQSGTKIIDIVNKVSEIVAVSVKEIKLEMLTDGEVNVQKFDFVGMKAETKEKQEESELKKTKVSQVMRVDVEKVEWLINLIGELVINQTRLAQLGKTLKMQFKKNKDIDSLFDVSQYFGRVIGDLQQRVMKIRMLPIEQLFNRFPRIIRDLSLSSGKKINFIVEGHDTEIDRKIIEEITDPLIHLLRNSIDHGIEEPWERTSVGKPEEGVVKISAGHKDNTIEIIIEDDGRGIDPEAIKKHAIKKGILKREDAETMACNDTLNLIYRPGFSTSEVVNEVSGRGVGMDIVKDCIEKANGVIDIETKVGLGTRFIIRLPLTLAIIPSLLVQIGRKVLAIPLSSVMEIVRMRKSGIISINKREAVTVRGKVLPLIRLHDKLGEHEQAGRENTFIVIVGSGEKRIGLVVDRLLGKQDVVTKSLGKYIGRVNGVTGATILGDGRVALILDISYIVRAAATER